MRTFSQHLCCQQRAWRTGIAESDSSFSTWRSCQIQTTTLGHTWRVVLDYRTSPIGCVKTSLVHDVAGRWTVITVFTWPPLLIRQETGVAVAVVVSGLTTIQYGYMTAHSSTYVETMCAVIAASLRTVWKSQWCFAPSTMLTCRDDAHLSRTLMPSRRFLPTTIVHELPESLIFSIEQPSRQENRQSKVDVQARRTGLCPASQRTSCARRTGTRRWPRCLRSLFTLHLWLETLQPLAFSKLVSIPPYPWLHTTIPQGKCRAPQRAWHHIAQRPWRISSQENRPPNTLLPWQLNRQENRQSQCTQNQNRTLLRACHQERTTRQLLDLLHVNQENRFQQQLAKADLMVCQRPCIRAHCLLLTCRKWEKKLQCWAQRQVPHSVKGGGRRDARSLRSVEHLVQMTVLFNTTPLTPLLTIEEWSGDSQSHRRSGSVEFMSNSTWRQTYDTKGKAPGQSAMPVDAKVAGKYRLPSASAVRTGLAHATWWSRHAWPEFTLCALLTLDWKPDHTRISLTCVSIGRHLLGALNCSLENRLQEQQRRLLCSHQENRWRDLPLRRAKAEACLGYRQLGWVPLIRRVGEAKRPGPSICSVNPGGWSRVEPTLNLKHDIVAVQETFVLREQMSSAKCIADRLGYYSSLTPARKTDGRPSGGLALLCRQAQPLQRMEKGAHWDLGRWAHHLLPIDGGLHVFKMSHLVSSCMAHFLLPGYRRSGHMNLSCITGQVLQPSGLMDLAATVVTRIIDD
eukprot:4173647-Amphidinium_carterae.1